jgi:hypothetical protein
MLKDSIARLGSMSKRSTVVVAVLAVSLVALAVASPALATPKGEYAVFSDCPLSHAELAGCVFAKTESGKFIVGKKNVPIEKVITLQGGFTQNAETGAITFVGAADGNTLSKTPQNVPGGLAGLINCKEISNFFERVACELIFENKLTGVSATTELAAPASSIGLNPFALLEEKGTALSLPVKVHLENPFLGSSCYVGSDSAPIILELTSGTTSPPKPNEPIKGSKGTPEVVGEGGILRLSKNSLVNNSFAAPGSNGCGGIFSGIIDPLVNASLGIPSAAGTNTAILEGTLEQAAASTVKAHE